MTRKRKPRTAHLRWVAHGIATAKLRREAWDLSTHEACERAYYAVWEILEIPADLTDQQLQRIGDSLWGAVQRVATETERGAQAHD
ncbi:hypothetical protein [Streptomyces sp. NBC_00299]|uniref:hypothetical protein n=1 Tax=Streptomyces sp. NBC_00299 TaxID=2975705 RepID=UPI002E2B7F5E|nr:hypothetical protein [Streptomyces sp. NBC_00299]